MQTEEVLALVPRLLRAALSGEMDNVENYGIQISRKLRRSHPTISGQIAEILTHYSAGASPLRSIGLQPVPTDQDSHMDLVRVEEPRAMEPPVLRKAEEELVNVFLKEWKARERLISQGLRPPSSLLLTGDPGVGKTYTAKYIASCLNLPMMSFDLATSISSFLGKTGQNIRAVLDYARANPCVLLLDEFDAIAKKRDDPGDLGELKRIVNVLLKELESWPVNGLVIAATNHPELLDKAIWRRFDYSLEIGKPQSYERQMLLERSLGDIFSGPTAGLVQVFVELTQGMSAADLCKYGDRVRRRAVLENTHVIRILFRELSSFLEGANSQLRGLYCRTAKRHLGDTVTVRELAVWVGMSPTAVHYHLKKEKGGI